MNHHNGLEEIFPNWFKGKKNYFNHLKNKVECFFFLAKIGYIGVALSS